MADRLEQARQAQAAGRHREAADLAHKLNAKKKSRTPETLLIEADSLVAVNDLPGAEACLKAGLRDKPGKPDFFLLSEKLTSVLTAQGLYKESMARLAKLEKLAPAEKVAELSFQRALLYSQMLQLGRASRRCVALMDDPRFRIPAALLLMEIGVQKSNMSEFDRAIAVLCEELASLSDTNLLAVIERTSRHRPAVSAEFFDEAMRRDLMPHRVRLFAARKLLDIGQVEEASRNVDEVDSNRIPSELKPLYFSLMAAIHERAGEYEQAFECFNQMNRFSRALLPQNWEENRFDPVHPYDEIRSAADGYETRVPLAFIVGFPRSGTTLLQTILDSQEGVAVIDEKPIIHLLKEKVMADGLELSDCLARMEQSYLDELRGRYFEHASEYVDDSGWDNSRLLVDKNPLQMIDLPFILALFPSAKILLSMRHPLDAILSCYQQTFEANTQMAYFTDWVTCFTHYRSVFQSYRSYRELLEVNDYTVRYESLVGDFEAETDRLFNFLGLEVNKRALGEFSRRAEGTMINTPSSSQVRQGVYTDAAFRWEKYAQFIDPHIPIIQDQLEECGYSAARVKIQPTDE